SALRAQAGARLRPRFSVERSLLGLAREGAEAAEQAPLYGRGDGAPPPGPTTRAPADQVRGTRTAWLDVRFRAWRRGTSPAGFARESSAPPESAMMHGMGEPVRRNPLEAVVDRILARAGVHVVVATPLGLGKPNRLLNAIYR